MQSKLGGEGGATMGGDGAGPAVRLSRPADGVGLVSLRAPQRRNAMDWAAWRALEEALIEARDDEGISVLVLTGEGPSFCAGGDLTSSPAAGTGVLRPAARLVLVQRVVRLLASFTKPTIAAVEGAAAGIGWTMVLACDLVIAGEGAFFAAPFIDRGMVPDGGLVRLLMTRLGHHRAAELLLLRRRLPAERAEALNLVNELVVSGSACDRALVLAGEIAASSLDAMQLTKRLLLAGGGQAGFDEFLATELGFAALALGGPDAAEGRSAFLNAARSESEVP